MLLGHRAGGEVRVGGSGPRAEVWGFSAGGGACRRRRVARGDVVLREKKLMELKPVGSVEVDCGWMGDLPD